MNSASIVQISLSLLAFSACASHPKQTKADQHRPNIIFILADDLGYGDLSCFGQKNFKTPFLDRMACEGILFTQHYSGSTVCAPSRCSLMTGMHTGHAYIRGNKELKPMGQEPLADSIVTVAEILKQGGYYTGLIGKWGLGGPDSYGIPNRQGFDYFYGYLCQAHAHNYYPEFLFRNTERIQLSNILPEPENLNGTGLAIVKNEYSHDLFAREALNFVKEHKDTSFFLYLAFTIPHANNEAKETGMEVPDFSQFTNEQWPDAEKKKAAMITRLDKDLGQLFAELKELDIDKNTLVIFTSDNGPHKEGGSNPDILDSNGPLRGIKRDMYEGGIRVPFIARWPGTIKPGTQFNSVSAFWDFLPTVCEIAGVTVPGNIDGISYLNGLTGKPQEQHKYLYWEFSELGGKQAVRKGNWKGVRNNLKENSNGPIELYDLSEDLSESDNIAKLHPGIVDSLAAIMEAAHVKSQLFPLPGEK